MRWKHESGQTMLLVALALVVLIMAAGLAIDMGYLRYQKRLLQMAADSAAIAGAANIIAGAANINCTGPDCVSGEAGINSWYNGFNPTSPGTTVTIGPPSAGPYAGNSNYVEAIITQKVPTFFMKILGPSFSSYSVSARAVAYPGPGPNCIYALQGGILFGGPPTSYPVGAQIQATGCALADGGDLSGPPHTDSYILDTGGAAYGGTYTAYSFSGGSAQPTPVPGAPAGNPLAYLSNNTPSVGAGGSPCGSYTYCAGSYPNGINIAGTSPSQMVSFQPGTYVLGGNGLTISGSGQVTGSGVTFYTNGNGAFSINSGSNYGDGTYDACGPSPATTTGMTVQLSAPTDPPYAGILFIQDDSVPNTTPASTITLNNGDGCNSYGQTLTSSPPSSYLWGVMYFPSGQLTLAGTGNDKDQACSTIPRFTIVIAYALYPEGNVNFGVNDCVSPAIPYTFATPLPDPIKDAVLVE